MSPLLTPETRFYFENFLGDNVHLDDHAQTLSVGQLQRLCFIRGMLLSPAVLLLDEPTSSLDQQSAAIVIDHIETLCKTSRLARYLPEPILYWQFAIRTWSWS